MPKCSTNQHEPVTRLLSLLRTCNLVVANPEHFYADDIGNHSEIRGNMGDLGHESIPNNCMDKCLKSHADYCRQFSSKFEIIGFFYHS